MANNKINKALKVGMRPLTLSNKRTLGATLAIVGVLGLMALVLAGCAMGLAISTVVRQSSRKEFAETVSQINTATDSINNMVKVLEATKSNGERLDIGEPLPTQKEFVTFVGESCSRLNLKMNKLTGGTYSSSNGVNQLSFVVEIQGEVKGVQDFLANIPDISSAYTINQVSYRNTNRYTWLDRGIDGNQTLVFWKEKEAEFSKELAEFNRANKRQVETEIIEPSITVNQLMARDEMTMYLDLSFVQIS